MGIKTFKTYLTEGFSAGDMKKAEKLIIRVLERKVGKKFNKFGTEEVVSGGVKKTGLKYFVDGTVTMVRFNWVAKHGSEIESVDVWDGQGDVSVPTVNIDCTAASVVKIIPKLAEIIKSPSSTAGQEFTINESDLSEMARPTGEIKQQFLTSKKITLAKFKKSKKLQNEFQRFQRQVKKGKGVLAEPTTVNVSKVKVRKGKKEIVKDDPEIAKGEKLLKKVSPKEIFEDLVSLSTMVIKGKMPSLIVTGMAGSGKTYEIQSQIKKSGLKRPDDWHLQKGHSSPFGLYSTLYTNRNKLIVFDDCDSVFGDAVSANLLKAALDSYDVREISWSSKSTIPKEMFDQDPDKYLSPEKGAPQYPDQFEFKGRIIFISNLPSSKIEPAIISRSLTIEIQMTHDELTERMQSIIEAIMPDIDVKVKQEVLDYMKEHAEDFAANETNMRTFVNSIKIRMCDPNWKRLCERYA